MINFDGELLSKDTDFLNHENRGLKYGDSLFETLRVINGKMFFWEEHYLRLMSSMRILRMEIPMNFTMEFLEGQIITSIKANQLQTEAARIRLTVFRKNGGLYSPNTNDVSFLIETKLLSSSFYTIEDHAYEVELFKDFFVNPDMLSTLKTNNRILNVVGSIFAKENDYQNCLLLNANKNVVEALNANLFLVKGKVIKTPPVSDGCLKGIIRNKLIGIIKNIGEYTLVEASISPFELQKADELFITNSIIGIQPITKYRKKEFESHVAKNLLGKLNAAARLG
ncbi:aminotransferase class IV [Maribacter sp. HTCC2170]|uniref:aminotransferase class IV n=1 Tax=Maribacter sp. (strain HTCC2170 / KCCM 42371) TaxID=313603 RepID=UPI00006BB863|nr:aminotransferase class IV [Maribacter sp. HTCC2170]EAQ99710.1 4-amino-4-deoxychorismate lyase, putative [Maribacter sp. HTCC2170]